MSFKPTALITGHEGFTGKLLGNKLAALNYEVSGLEGDITDYPSVLKIIKAIKPDFIVNLAGVANVAQKDSELFYKVNLFGALNILQAIEEAKLQPKKIIMAGSAYIY